MTALLAAILAVEGWKGPGTVGNAGEIGPYQITLAYWQDARMSHGTHADCERREYAEEVMRRYWHRFCPAALRDRNYRVLAAVHHFGPSGVKFAQGGVDDYVERVANSMGGGK